MTDRYNTPDPGTTDWHIPINENFAALDRDVEHRDIESNRDQYDPVQNAKFLATDTGSRFIGDGDQWVVLPMPSSGSRTTARHSDVIIVQDGSDFLVEYSDGGDLFDSFNTAVEAVQERTGGDVTISCHVDATVSTPVQITKPNVTLDGCGSRLTAAVGFPNGVDDASVISFINIEDPDRSVVRRWHIDGQKSNQDIDNNRFNGIGGTTSPVQDVWVERNYIENVTQQGIGDDSMRGASRIVFNKIENPTTRGMRIHTPRRGTIFGWNHISYDASDEGTQPDGREQLGMSIEGVDTWVVGNYLDMGNTDINAISLQSSDPHDNIKLEGNIFLNGGAGVSSEGGGRNLSLVNNYFQGFGAAIKSLPDHSLVSNNIFRNCEDIVRGSHRNTTFMGNRSQYESGASGDRGIEAELIECLVIGNRFGDIANNGIVEDGDSATNIYIGNHVDGNIDLNMSGGTTTAANIPSF